MCRTDGTGPTVASDAVMSRRASSARIAGDFRAGVNAVIANANLDRFLGCVLLISLLVSVYLTMEEIDRAMGKGALFDLFFRRPTQAR